jgi:signal transduction histidine kinase
VRLLLLVGLAASVVFALGARGAFQRDIAERMSQHVAALAGERFADPTSLRRRLEQIRTHLGIDVTVRDLDGRLVAAAGPELPALSPGDARAVRSGRVVIDTHPAWFAASVVRDPTTGSAVGTVEASVHRRFGWTHLLRPALVVGLVLLIVAVATRPLARRISRPLERLTAATRRFGGGDLATRVDVAEHRGWGRRARPVEELAELTRAFNEMAERVERLVRGQKELLANVSHELRSPLARIRVALELVPRDAATETRLSDVERDLAELERLVDDVLTTARLEATGLPTHLGPVHAVTLLGELVERARLDPVTARADVRVSPSEALELVGDETLLRRALWNLVENAAKYGAPPVTLGAARRGSAVVLSVADDGPGIHATERERVLDPFYRGDAARTPSRAGESPRGVGLGLTLARQVAEVHGGAIEIGPASTVEGRERGCRVALVIPAREQPEGVGSA